MIGIQISGKQGIDRWIKIIDILQIEACQIVLDPMVFRGPKARYHYQSLFEELKTRHHIKKIFIHAPDHSTMGGFNRHQRFHCWKTLRKQLELCENMGVDGLVVHVNLSSEMKENALKQELTSVFFDALITTLLLMENTTYPKGSYSCDLNLLGQLVEWMNSLTPTAICLDSAHLFATGYLFETKEIASKLKEQFFSFFNQVKLLHLNDSKEIFGSYLDRHELPGKGYIGMGSLGALLSLFDAFLPTIIEAPQIPFEELIQSVEASKVLIQANSKIAPVLEEPEKTSWIY